MQYKTGNITSTFITIITHNNNNKHHLQHSASTTATFHLLHLAFHRRSIQPHFFLS